MHDPAREQSHHNSDGETALAGPTRSPESRLGSSRQIGCLLSVFFFKRDESLQPHKRADVIGMRLYSSWCTTVVGSPTDMEQWQAFIGQSTATFGPLV